MTETKTPDTRFLLSCSRVAMVRVCADPTFRTLAKATLEHNAEAREASAGNVERFMRACTGYARGAGANILKLARGDVAVPAAGQVVVLEASDFDDEIDRLWREDIALPGGKSVRQEFAGGGKSAFRAWAEREGPAELGIGRAS